MAKLADSDVTGSTGGGKRFINKRYELTSTQLAVGAIVLYLFFNG